MRFRCSSMYGPRILIIVLHLWGILRIKLINLILLNYIPFGEKVLKQLFSFIKPYILRKMVLSNLSYRGSIGLILSIEQDINFIFFKKCSHHPSSMRVCIVVHQLKLGTNLLWKWYNNRPEKNILIFNSVYGSFQINEVISVHTIKVASC